MSVNRERPHVFVLPEDEANLQLATEFLAQIDANRQRQMYVLDVADGWNRVLTLFESVHVTEMDRYPRRFMILLIDFDGRQERLNVAKAKIPDHLSDRVFVLGALTNPEDLRRALGSYQDIGSAMASDCREETNTIWGNPLLQHNTDELNRLREHVRPILFP
jgi:hypothetical protein